MNGLSKKVEKFATQFGLRISHNSEALLSIETSPFLGIKLQVRFEEDDMPRFYFFQRTYSGIYDGERTDLHDVIPMVFASYLKSIGLSSCVLIDIDHPVIEFEIYGRYIMPIQINSKFIESAAMDEGKLLMLVSILGEFEMSFWKTFNGCPCDNCRSKNNFDFAHRWEGIEPGRIQHVINAVGKRKHYTYCERTLPTWFYYRDYKRRITVIESPQLAGFVRFLVSDTNKIVNGIEGDIYLDLDFKNHLNHKTQASLKKYFGKLNDSDPKFILVENKIFAIGEKYLVITDEPCGIYEYRQEKERIRERREVEFALLFNTVHFDWSDKIDPALFEDLIKDLLERENSVTRVRKMANTRERDGGTDLTAEWTIPKQHLTEDEKNPFQKVNVIVQCKAHKNAVGKSDVLDIRDTVDSKNYQGYFLAVAGYMKKSLTDYLDKLRNSNHLWIDWWTRSEIEDRLRKHEDLIIKYRALLSVKDVDTDQGVK